MNNNQLVKAHIAIGNRRRELTKEYEKVDADLKSKQELIENVMLKTLIEGKTESMRTDAGTFYRQEDIKPAASDWGAFYEWIKENDAFEALEKRITKTFIKTFMAENKNALPPGVSVFRSYVVRVRRPSKGTETQEEN